MGDSMTGQMLCEVVWKGKIGFTIFFHVSNISICRDAGNLDTRNFEIRIINVAL